MDVKVQWDAERQCIDWVMQDGDLVADDSLDTAIIISLFTNIGWWGDALKLNRMGSKLYLLKRGRKSSQTPIITQAQDYTREALAWLVRDGLALEVKPKARWEVGAASPTLVLSIEVKLTDGSFRNFKYDLRA